MVRLAHAALASLGSGLALSRLYRSPAWPDPEEPSYINAVARLNTSLSAPAMLSAMQAIEAGFGRLRPADPALRYAPRTLDLDLLALGDERHDSETLMLPHPRISERDFVLLPLRDVAPGWRHPVTGALVEALVAALPSITAEPLEARR